MTPHPPGRRSVLASLLVLAASASAPLASSAPLSAIAVRQAWVRPAAAGLNAAGYMTIVNSGPFADRVTSVSSPVAGRVSLHESRQVGAIMTMRAMPGLRIPSKGRVALAPGGYHLMLEGLRRPLRLGEHVPVTLMFDRAGAIRARLVVGAGPAMSGMRM